MAGKGGLEIASLKAVMLVALAYFAWGLDNNLTSLIDGYSTAQITWVKGICAGSIIAPMGWWFGGHASGLQLGAALLIGAIGYGASLVLYVAGAQQLGATRSQLCFSTAPVFGLAAAWAVFGEPIGYPHLVAVSMMGAAIWLLQNEQHQHEHRHEPLEHTHWHRHDDDHHTHAPMNPLPPESWHQHVHRHEPLSHSHSHRPDLHHRHDHGVGRESEGAAVGVSFPRARVIIDNGVDVLPRCSRFSLTALLC